MTPQERRNLRLKNDYEQMKNIQGNIIQWEALRGNPPYVEEYRLTVNVRTIISSAPSYRDSHILTLTIPSSYPESAPTVVMDSQPKPYHPNWFPNGRWCYGTWILSEALGMYVVRMIRTLQFDPDITNPQSPADGDANRWYQRNQNRGLFPCDRQVLPDPTKSRFGIQPQQPKKFQVNQ